MSFRGARSVRVFLTILFTFFAIALPVSAQDATPAGLSDIPDASECTVEPVDPSSLVSLISGGGTSLLTSTPVPETALPEGPEAIEEEIEAVNATVRQLVACANLGDPFRILALLSDDFKASLAATVLTSTQENAEEFLGQFPVPLFGVAAGDELPMIMLRDGRLLPDGNVGFILEPIIPGLIGNQPLFFVEFTETRTGWLIDNVVIVETEDVGTPAA